MTSKNGGDSIYCFFILGTTVYCWNVITNFTNQFTNYTDVNYFDVTMSSTNSLYLIIDRAINNDVRMFGSTTSGASWGGAVFLSSTGANPTITMSGTGDTALIVYNGVAILADTNTGAIRSVRYREGTPGTLLIDGTFHTNITAGTAKPQFKGVINAGKAWLFYTSGTTGSMDLNCMLSTDNGITFGTASTIGTLTGRDEYWFDASYYNSGSLGVDVVYYSDSAQTGTPDNISDKLFYTYADISAPSTFNASVQISEHPPQSSTRNYYPNIIENYGGARDMGVLWVGLNGTNPGVYYDRLNAVVPVELSSFTSSIVKNSVNLNWQTQFEINNSSFEIQRKSEADNWSIAGSVTGAGTTNFPVSYSFTDKNLQTGRYSYRLKQIDYNGSFKYYYLSNEIVIGTPFSFELSQNYPNPFNPYTVINYQLSAAGFVSLKVIDISGREVSSLVNEVKNAGYYSVTFDAKSLSSGTYFYKLSTDKFSDVKKMVVVK
ncbi:MAG: T9SS type A sorting domain-containing protein [Bacteroidetes bacterium]|nr:T9SS type A sorting domain-containing protein [Bacteroidota bacterium]